MHEFTEGSVEGAAPGQYVFVEDPKAGRLLRIVCPRCANALALPNHQVMPNGVVVPAVRCPFAGCGFMGAAKLKGKETVNG